MSYFRAMGTLWYTLNSGEQIIITDITKFETFIQQWIDNPNAFLQYTIKDDERVDQISYHIYDTTEYWWTILLFNQIYDMNEQWPRSTTDLYDYISKKYPFNNPTDIHHYVDNNGFLSDITALKYEYDIQDTASLIDTLDLIPVTIFDYEYQINENKRFIKIIDPDIIGQVISQYEDLMSS